MTGKEQLETAIKLLETILDPANQPAQRGFDFRRDYIVLNRLGNVLFKRSQMELDDPVAESALLLRAIEAYERVLAIDSEDVETHYGLSQCYDRLARDLPPDAKATRAPATDAVALQQLGEALADSAQRKDAALALVRDLPEFLARPLADFGKPPKLAPKLPTIRLLIPRVRDAFRDSVNDATTRQALAQVLAALHSTSNLIYKPDDLARSHALNEYRRKNPAANYAAEAIVLYPTTPAQIEDQLKRKAPSKAEGGQ